MEEYIVKVEELQRSRRVLQNELIRRILHNIHWTQGLFYIRILKVYKNIMNIFKAKYWGKSKDTVRGQVIKIAYMKHISNALDDQVRSFKEYYN